MSILKLFVDTSVSFSAKGGNYYPPLNCEYSGFRFINEKEKMEKKKRFGESSTIILIFDYSF